jgi:hypothetical protein
MSTPIKNPYVSAYSKVTKSWTVYYRYILNGKIQFKHVCNSRDQDVAEHIAKVLNKELEHA